MKKLITRTASAILAAAMCLCAVLFVAAEIEFETGLPDYSANVARYAGESSVNAFTDVDVVMIDCSQLASLRLSSVDLLNTGKILYIENPTVSIAAAAKQLAIPQNGTDTYWSDILLAYTVQKVYDKYVFTPHYAVIGEEDSTLEPQSEPTLSEREKNWLEEPEDWESVDTNFNDAVTLAEYRKTNDFSFDTQTVINAAMQQRAEYIAEGASPLAGESESVEMSQGDDMVSASGSFTYPSGNFYRAWTGVLYVYKGNPQKPRNYLGYVNCGLRAYVHGRSFVNNVNSHIYTMVAGVKAYPKDRTVAVRKYSAKLNCNVKGFSCLDASNLLSGVTQTQTVSVSYDSGNGGTTGAGFEKSWQYNPESQYIDETSSSPRIIKWQARPASVRRGKAFGVAPGIMVASPVGYCKGTWEIVECNALFLGTTIHNNNMKIGGWFA